MHGFDYTALHWADKQKPLEEVAGTFSVFPETLSAPPLVPEAIDKEAPNQIPAEQVMPEAVAEMSVAFSDHFVLLNELARYRARGRAQEMAA
ncbi:hypothetical protein ACVW0I_008612 [Bradyrhizobium sp. LM6.11]